LRCHHDKKADEKEADEERAALGAFLPFITGLAKVCNPPEADTQE